MVSEKALIFFVMLLLFMPEKNHCKFEKIEQFLKKYEVSKSTELTNKFRIKFPTFENAERSIEIRGFNNSFILDLSIYFHHEDANIEYISKESNSTGRFQDLKALLYQGHVRDTTESFALGFFTQNNLFRGYFLTDEVYCVEPHGDKTSVIIYKLSDVIFPGCSKTDKGDGLDCSKTKYFEPWKPSKPTSKVKFDYRVYYDKYFQLFSDTGYQKIKNETHTKKYSDSEGLNNDSGEVKNYREAEEKEKNSSNTVNTNEHHIKDKKHHKDTENEHDNENNNHHNDKKKENDKTKVKEMLHTEKCMN